MPSQVAAMVFWQERASLVGPQHLRENCGGEWSSESGPVGHSGKSRAVRCGQLSQAEECPSIATIATWKDFESWFQRASIHKVLEFGDAENRLQLSHGRRDGTTMDGWMSGIVPIPGRLLSTIDTVSGRFAVPVIVSNRQHKTIRPMEASIWP